MTWFAVGGLVVGAVGSAYSSHQQANAQNAANRGAGRVDVTTSNNPNPDVLPAMRDALNRSQGALDRQTDYAPPAPATPARGGGGGARRPAAAPQQTLVTQNGQQGVIGAGGRFQALSPRQIAAIQQQAPAAGGTAAPAGPFQGQSGQTAQAISDAQRVAGDMEHGPVTTAAQNYAAQTLAGNDQNAYRTETADMLRNQNDPNLQRYLDELFNADNGLGGQGSGSGASRTSPQYRGDASRVWGSATPGSTASTIPASSGGTGAEAALRALIAGGDAPGAQAMRDRIRHNADAGYNEQVRQRRLQASGSGMYGGTGQLADEAYSEGQYGTGLADAYAQQDFDTYRQALGLGTQYDSAALDRAAQERMSNASNSASAGAAAAGIAAQERIARLNALGNAVGMSTEQGQFRTSGMGSLAGGFSSDQQAAAHDAGMTSALGQSGYLNAGNLSLGSDQARVGWQGNNNQLRGAQIAANTARSELAQHQYEYNRQAPLNDMTQYAGILNSLYGNYGSQTTFGEDRRNQSPGVPINQFGQTVAGAAGGYQIGSQIAATRAAAAPTYPSAGPGFYVGG